jgi:glutamate-5-semialdehyde dehydrogenase
VVKDYAMKMKKAAPIMGTLSSEVRNNAIQEAIKALLSNKKAIIEENQKDIDEAIRNNISQAIIKRLVFDDSKIEAVTKGLADLIELEDPLGKVLLKRQLDEGLILHKETCPIGVIGVIFEARPDALIQIASLCIKSGNCIILKGGSETKRTNRIIFTLLHEAVQKAGLPLHCMYQAEARSDVDDLLQCEGYVDLIIPRGSNSFVRYIMDNTRIPVIGHADGLTNIYVDKTFDLKKAIDIIVDSKIQYVAVCNAVENLIVHREAAKQLLPGLNDEFKKNSVVVRGTDEVREIIDCEKADEADFTREYLDYIISIELVDSIEEAIDIINTLGSHHTDCIISEDLSAGDKFMNLVDSANVFMNCSTRFSDGYRYGFGAEVGVSTGKIHARGPVGLEGMITYKYKLYGNGHMVKDYADGSRFKFKDII